MFTNLFLRKLFLLTAFLSILTAGLHPAGTARAAGAETAYITSTALNLRSGPGLDQKILKVLAQGTAVTVISTNSAGDWSEVRLADSTTGWVYRQYLVRAAQGGSEVIVDRLNLRAGPGTSYRILRTLSRGDKLVVTGRSLASDWLVVRLSDGTSGWTFSPFVATDADIAALPVAEAYGGQYGTGSPNTPARSSVLVTIRDNQAVVDVSGFPAGEEITASLGLPGKSPDLKMAAGKTNASGSARLTFSMPKNWSDGSTLSQTDLRLLVSTASGSKSMSVSVVYLRY